MHFHRRLASLLLSFVLAVPPAWADGLPELGDAASAELSPATERRIGQQIMFEIQTREPSYLDDVDVAAYLNQLGGRLVAVSTEPGLPFRFFAINEPSINAFAMPGGFIGVHSGLILAAQSESELAGVLAHEIAHVTQRHIARQVFQSKQVSVASMVAMGLALLAARSNSQVAGAAIATSQAGALSAQLAFSRDFERESDRLGFELLQRAGFDVRGMSGFFVRLQQSVRLYENNATAYLRTHPLTGERLADMQNREQILPYRQVPDSLEFHLIRARLRALQATPSDHQRELQRALADKKYASEAAVHYGLAVTALRLRDPAAAIQASERAASLGVSSPMIERLRAETRLAAGETGLGLARYREAMSKYPVDRALVRGYGQALLSARRFAEALSFAQQQLVASPEEPEFYRWRAEAYAGLGQRARQHQALGENLAVQGQLRAAIEQFQIAQRAGDADFYAQSEIDARLRELKRVQLEEQKDRRN